MDLIFYEKLLIYDGQDIQVHLNINDFAFFLLFLLFVPQYLKLPLIEVPFSSLFILFAV